VELRSERLLLRRFSEADRAAFARMNADPRVMEHFPAPLSRDESDAQLDRIEQHWRENGFGIFAVEREAQLIGAVGLARPAFTASFTPCIEIAWRFGAEHWGHGYATEGARAAVRLGFEVLGLDEIVSFTVVANQRSRRVMEKLGMRLDGEFDHPLLPEGHPLRRHVLYRLGRVRAASKRPQRGNDE
jgi:ribosomal-protein-alanine N-acetyltransferase